jgi:hypothetical protein
MLIGITAAIAVILAGLAIAANRQDAGARRLGQPNRDTDTQPIKR